MSIAKCNPVLGMHLLWTCFLRCGRAQLPQNHSVCKMPSSPRNVPFFSFPYQRLFWILLSVLVLYGLDGMAGIRGSSKTASDVMCLKRKQNHDICASAI